MEIEPLPSYAKINDTMPKLLKKWFDTFSPKERKYITSVSGHVMKLLELAISPKFIQAATTMWDWNRQAFRIAGRELAPILEEYAHISGLGLHHPHAQVTIESMREYLEKMLSLKGDVVERTMNREKLVPVVYLLSYFRSKEDFEMKRNLFRSKVGKEDWD